MIRAHINWRLALYAAGLIGGALWGVLAGFVMGAQNGSGSTQFNVAASSWWLAVATSGAVLAAGALTTSLARGIVVRSLGIALVVGALSGWLMVGCLAVQGL